MQRVFEEDAKLLQYFASHGVEIGSELFVKGPHPYADATEYVTPAGNIITLGKIAGDTVLVEVL